MIWVDIAAVIIGISLLALVALRLYRQTKRVSRTIKDANQTISELTADLEVSQRAKTSASSSPSSSATTP